MQQIIKCIASYFGKSTRGSQSA